MDINIDSHSIFNFLYSWGNTVHYIESILEDIMVHKHHSIQLIQERRLKYIAHYYFSDKVQYKYIDNHSTFHSICKSTDIGY